LTTIFAPAGIWGREFLVGTTKESLSCAGQVFLVRHGSNCGILPDGFQHGLDDYHFCRGNSRL